MSMTARSYEKELLDADNIPFSDILQVLKELDVINSRLGGHVITRRGIDYFLNRLPARKPLTIAEIGCGGGDNLLAVDDYMKKRNYMTELVGVDMKEECIQFAKQRSRGKTIWITSDYNKLVWPAGKPDIIFSSLFCHHFTDEQLVEQLQWLKANSKLGFFINDLHRHPLAYYSIKLLTALFSSSPLVKYDAPLSVKRAFKKNEWIKLLAAAGITNYTITWQWAFRYLICVPNE